MIYIHPKLPRTKKSYEKAVEDNTDKLKQIMSELTIQEAKPEPVLQRKVGGLPWEIGSKNHQGSFGRPQKNKKAKTFKL